MGTLLPLSITNVVGKVCSIQPLLALGLPLAVLPAVLAALPGAGAHARAQTTPDEVPLADVVEVLFIDRDLVAVDAQGGGQTTQRLRLGEILLWKGSQGKVGMAFTDQRILAVASESAAWAREERLLDEVLPERALLGDRVALAATSRRVLGFTSAGNIIESSLGLRERVLVARTGENVAVLVTDRRALGVSPQAGGFFATPIQLEERVESVEAVSNLATVTTDRRVLIFRGPFGSWEERRRDLR
jgi:hypothetical protein